MALEKSRLQEKREPIVFVKLGPITCTHELSREQVILIRGVFAVVGAVLLHFTFGHFYTIANMVPYIMGYIKARVNPKLDDNVAVWLSALAFGMQGVTMPLGGLLSRMCGYRVVIAVSCLTESAGVFLTYFTIKHSFLSVLITYSLLKGAGIGLGYSIVLAVACSWFPKHRGLVIGLIVGGFGLGALVFAPIQTQYINPNNIPVDNQTRQFTDKEVLDRVPKVFLRLGSALLTVQFTAFFLLKQRPGVPVVRANFGKASKNNVEEENKDGKDGQEPKNEEQVKDAQDLPPMLEDKGHNEQKVKLDKNPEILVQSDSENKVKTVDQKSNDKNERKVPEPVLRTPTAQRKPVRQSRITIQLPEQNREKSKQPPEQKKPGQDARKPQSVAWRIGKPDQNQGTQVIQAVQPPKRQLNQQAQRVRARQHSQPAPSSSKPRQQQNPSQSNSSALVEKEKGTESMKSETNLQTQSEQPDPTEASYQEQPPQTDQTSEFSEKQLSDAENPASELKETPQEGPSNPVKDVERPSPSEEPLNQLSIPSKTPPSVSHTDEVNYSPTQVLKRCDFYLLWLVLLFGVIPISIITAAYKYFGQKYISDDRFLSLVVTISSLFNSGGRIIWGIMVDKLSFKIPLCGMLLFWAALLASFPHLSHTEGLTLKILYAIWVCLMFVSLSGMFAIMPAATSTMFGSLHLAVNYGMLFTALAFGSILSGLTTQFLAKGDSYLMQFTVCSIFCVLAFGTLIWIEDRKINPRWNIFPRCVCRTTKPEEENSESEQVV